MNKIKHLTIVSNDWGVAISVGHGGVVEIRDNTREGDDCYDPVYEVYGEDNKLMREIINCPVDIIYY
jgi:hypothetical protein